MEQKLVDYIMGEVEFLGFGEMFNEETKPVVRYFLEKNIKAILGKTEFNINQGDNSELLVEKVVGSEENPNRLVFDIGGNEFSINYNDGVLNFGDCAFRSPNGLSKITFDKDNNGYTNVVTYPKDDTFVQETQKVSLGEDKIFEYQKEVGNSIEEITKYPRYMMHPIGAKNNPDSEMFEFISPEETGNKNDSFLKKIIEEVKNPSLVSVKTQYGDPNILAYIDKIYGIENNNKLTKII